MTSAKELAASEVQYYVFLLPACLADWSNRLLIQYLILCNGWSSPALPSANKQDKSLPSPHPFERNLIIFESQ